MKTAPLGEIADIVSGATPKTGVGEYWDGDVQWATPSDLSKLVGPYISSTPRTLTEAGVRSCATTILPIGSVLLSSRAPIGHVAINTVPMATNQGFKSLVPGPDLDAKYLYHWLKSKTDYLQSLGNGATFKELSKKTTEQIDIPFPPLPEQRRIASILDQADAIRTKRRQVLTNLDALAQSMFHDMFGDPDAATENVPFGDVATLAGGRNLVGDDSAAYSEYRVLKISAVTTGRFKPDESKPLPPGYVPPKDHLVRQGDLLMSRANTTELVGAVAFVTSTPSNLALPDKVWRFSWRSEVEPTYWHALLSTPAIRRRISRLASGTGGSMKNVAKAKLEVMPVPHIKLERQREFADRSAQIEEDRVTLLRALTAGDELFWSLRSRAFRGELG
ncbi:restriction endonuclease subunit S [Georgenia sp. M64]|uniref:restriction endonuclease subunit S n=1 Tax=Georgenia sp. M64 TaxID=3120520 RepID=UPI0030E53887